MKERKCLLKNSKKFILLNDPVSAGWLLVLLAIVSGAAGEGGGGISFDELIAPLISSTSKLWKYIQWKKLFQILFKLKSFIFMVKFMNRTELFYIFKYGRKSNRTKK